MVCWNKCGITFLSVGNKIYVARARTAEDRTMISSSWLHLKSDVIIRVCLSCWNKTKLSLWWKYEQANKFIINVQVLLHDTVTFNFIFVWAPYSYSSFLLPLIQNVNQNAGPWYVCLQDLVHLRNHL